MEEERRRAPALWGHEHLPLLARARSRESLEYILQALWRTRRTGLDATDRAVFRDVLQLSDDVDLAPLLVCLRILVRRCVSAKDDIQKLFPEEVPPELRKLLGLLLQKFQPEWLEDAAKDQASALRSETADCQLNQNGDASEQPAAGAAATAKVQNGTAPAKDSVESGEKELKKFPLAKDSLDKMLKDLFSTKDPMQNAG